MYIPAAFAQTETSTLHDFIEQHSFGLLVSEVEGAPFATHLPFLLDRAAGPRGRLTCHVARANPQWKEANGRRALAVFSGPHAYISPSWYEAEDVVPTWNYVAVHVYGSVQTIEDRGLLFDIVQSMVSVYEASLPHPWSLAGRNPFIERMLAQIVGLQIEIERIEGKWKLNQNHPAERREKVIRALREDGGENALAVAGLMHTLRGT